MHLQGLLSILCDDPDFARLRDHLIAGDALPDQRLLRAARPFAAAALVRDLKRPTVIVTATVDRAYNVAEQLPVWLPETPILRFGEPGALFYERSGWASHALRGRLATLGALVTPIGSSVRVQHPPVIITSALALMTRTLPPREFRAASRVLKVGARHDPDKLMRHWLSIGYSPTSIVTEPGTFARRGGIIDLFPISADQPVRLEFFDDEIERLRWFDPASQRSVASVDEVSVIPAREALPKFGGQVAAQLAGWFEGQPDSQIQPDSSWSDGLDLASEAAFPTLEFYLPYFYDQPAALIDYLPPESLLIVEDWSAFEDTVGDLEAQAVQLREEKARAGALPPDYPLPYLPIEDLRELIKARHPLHFGGAHDEAEMPQDSLPILGALFVPETRFGGGLRPFFEALPGLPRAVVVSNQAQRLAELWNERGYQSIPVTRIESQPRQNLYFVEGTLTEGFAFKAGGLHLFTDAEIFGWKRPEPRRRQVQRPVSPEAYFADLAAGDFVVHIEYGIGRFMGLQKRSLDGGMREYLTIQYAGSDTLYVPIHQADRLSRYVGADDAEPTLSKLGSGEWTQAKESARRAAEQIASELLELYAQRAMLSGHTFSPDTPWQAELEASFPYIETEDQLRVLSEVKADMERPAPMDRLICGDVGYGKTEVAIRAAFKAIMDGTQVAVLVPTTILAQQHWNTFSQRFAAFPVKVEMLSRFRSPREQHQILEQAARGEVDVLIGTHRILQSDVIFRNLGLLIIDEEQRFGVTHKERLKRMRAEVDVLTMTATPIPRTLYMSLAGIRDISMIQTPPAERLPVITHVGSYDEGLVRTAILRELDRGGQVYFVHNRVMTINATADHLRRIVPEARIVIGHGQMHEDELEKVMARFAGGDGDVLLCTTIIESGLDIPNANTIIIDRADTFGLAQLYQLRGRVGRGANRAYAYLFHAKGSPLTAEARARLETIGEQTELGAGLSIAMRDLEIRGAGELLGARQSGYIASVGFHLYTQILAREVNRLRAAQGSAAKPETAPIMPLGAAPAITLDLPIRAFVPVDFMPDSAMRLQFYRRIADLHTPEAVDEIEAELADRFGALPSEVQGLLFQIRVKLLAVNANVTAITVEENQIAVRLPYLAHVDRGALQRYLGGETRVSRTAVWLARNNGDWQPRLLELLEKLPVQPSLARMPGA